MQHMFSTGKTSERTPVKQPDSQTYCCNTYIYVYIISIKSQMHPYGLLFFIMLGMSYVIFKNNLKFHFPSHIFKLAQA